MPSHHALDWSCSRLAQHTSWYSTPTLQQHDSHFAERLDDDQQSASLQHRRDLASSFVVVVVRTSRP